MNALELLTQAKTLFENDCVFVGSDEWVWLQHVEHLLWRNSHPTPVVDEADNEPLQETQP